MIKSYKQFINESTQYPPGKNDKFISLTSEEIKSFQDTPVLTNLIVNQKVTLLGDKVFYHESDIPTKEMLDEYFPEKIEN